jgi:L-rhamnose-H+ transport protein
MLTGLLLAVISGIANGLFTAPMKVIRKWRWENIWLVFILIACLAMPLAIVLAENSGLPLAALRAMPPAALSCALVFGFAWGFGAILFGRSVDRLGVSLANSLVIGISSALGSLVPVFFEPNWKPDLKFATLLAGVVVFLAGVAICGVAGRLRQPKAETGGASLAAYLFCLGAGVMSAVFNIGYTLALPMAEAGVRQGMTRFAATNLIWMLMLGAGSLPNIGYCAWLMRRNASAPLLLVPGSGASWGLALAMGLLWGGSIFLYGAATPRLGHLGPSIGWPLSLAVGLLVANLMGLLLGEWRQAVPRAAALMRLGILTLLAAILLCSWSASI